MIYHMDRVQEWRRGERIAPIHIDMGLTKFCNIACIYCIGVTQGGMKKGQMIQPDALLRLIRDAGRLQVRSVAFIGDGEPTLNPALYDAIVLARECGVETAMATNGILLDMNRAHDVLRNQTFVRFNLSAGNSEGFRRIHQAAPALFDELIQKIRELVRLRKENQYGCTLGLQMVLIPENFDQVLTLARLGADLGVDYLQVKQCSDTEYGELGIQREEYRRVVDTLKEAESLSREDYSVQVKWNKINILAETDVYRHGIRKYDICYGTPMLGQISGNGKVYPCGPFFGKDRFLIGDIHRMSYYDMIKGDRYWAVQRDIVENIDVHCDCTIGCRQDYINTFLWDLMNPPAHVNFI
ncbi:MAG: radical SAM protein [Lentisphaerae bacterium RIFOXYB12_FULL_65_16]|nr:MAG: radical SAM protein [Lentisphaerae bacterium RIFOXYA12_64_32]OGV91326.1 MAG: radical SAM protein [Lentisphaerae bacterium RIFOXYB12_FULL_65_16]